MKKQFILVVIAALVAIAIDGQESNCKLPKDLFKRRSALVAELVKRQGDAALSKELESTNAKYFQFIVTVSQKEDATSAHSKTACCESSSQDPIADIICKFSEYLKSDRKNTELLVDSVPTSSQGREALWALDEIAHVHDQDHPGSFPALFGPSGPVTLYIDELYRLGRSGDRKALSKFLGLYSFSDGEYAEQMDDQMEKLFNSDLDFVLRQWDLFERNHKALVKVRDYLPSDEKQTLRTKLAAEKECATRSQACAELKTLLAQ